MFVLATCGQMALRVMFSSGRYLPYDRTNPTAPLEQKSVCLSLWISPGMNGPSSYCFAVVYTGSAESRSVTYAVPVTSVVLKLTWYAIEPAYRCSSNDFECSVSYVFLNTLDVSTHSCHEPHQHRFPAFAFAGSPKPTCIRNH